MKRINLTKGTAIIDQKITQKTLKSLNKMAELASKIAKKKRMSDKRKIEKFDEIMSMIKRAGKEDWTSDEIHENLVRVTAYY